MEHLGSRQEPNKQRPDSQELKDVDRKSCRACHPGALEVGPKSLGQVLQDETGRHAAVGSEEMRWSAGKCEESRGLVLSPVKEFPAHLGRYQNPGRINLDVRFDAWQRRDAGWEQTIGMAKREGENRQGG